MTKQKTKPRHLFIHLLNYVIHTNALRQKGKKEKRCARNAYTLFFYFFSSFTKVQIARLKND